MSPILQNGRTLFVTILLAVFIVSAHADASGFRDDALQHLQEWSRVQALSPGAKIEVTVQGSGRRVRQLIAADSNALLLHDIDSNLTEKISREQIVEISLITKAVRRGAAIGTVVGLVVGGVAQHGSPGWTALMGAISAGWGAFIGKDFLIRRVIYRAPTI